MGLIDTDTFSGTITAGSSETLSVATANADRVVLIVDDGSQDGTPAQYDLTQRVKYRHPDLNRFQFYDEETGITYRSVVDPAAGQEWQVEITNSSGADATYAIALGSRKGD